MQHECSRQPASSNDAEASLDSETEVDTDQEIEQDDYEDLVMEVVTSGPGFLPIAHQMVFPSQVANAAVNLPPRFSSDASSTTTAGAASSRPIAFNVNFRPR